MEHFNVLFPNNINVLKKCKMCEIYKCFFNILMACLSVLKKSAPPCWTCAFLCFPLFFPITDGCQIIKCLETHISFFTNWLHGRRLPLYNEVAFESVIYFLFSWFLPPWNVRPHWRILALMFLLFNGLCSCSAFSGPQTTQSAFTSLVHITFIRQWQRLFWETMIEIENSEVAWFLLSLFVCHGSL